jgi:hypothetical protein
LDGGHFAEAAIRILYHQDTGNVDWQRSFDDCANYVESGQVEHRIQPVKNGRHVVRVLRTVYKFRNQRGVAHISPTYAANHMDSKLIIECVRWCMNEILRLFWRGDRETVARTIRELLQFDVPCVGVFEDVILVQRTDLSTEEEILVLLHFAGEQGFSRSEIGKFAKRAPSSVFDALQTLLARDCRQVVKVTSGNYRLTDLGSRRTRNELSQKLLLQ